MAWDDALIGRKPQDSDEEKLNFGGRNSYSDIEPSREPAYSYELAYEDLEIVNPCMITANMNSDDGTIHEPLTEKDFHFLRDSQKLVFFVRFAHFYRSAKPF